MGEVIDPVEAPDATLEELFGLLVRAKQSEKIANEHRLKVEGLILSRIAQKPEKGRVKLEGGPITATVEFKLNYKADVEALKALGSDVVRRKETWELDVAAYEALRTTNPVRFAQLAQHVETKPAKPAFELKV